MTERDETSLTRELLQARLDASISEIRTRLESMDQALDLAQQYPTAIDKAIGHLRELHGQRFDALEQRLDEQRTAEKEARDTAERSLREQLAGIERALESRNETTLTKVGALEQRISRLDGEKSGATANWGWIIGVIGLLIAALAVGTRLPW